jgi:putative oxidoreductase
MWPLYSMKPSFLNLFMKNLARGRVAPIISASISCDTLAKTFCGWPWRGTVVGAIAVAVARQTDWPARQPSSKNHRDNHVLTVFCKGDDSHPPIVLAFHPAGESFFKQPIDCDNMYLYQ